jgi:hypothetical protein
MFFVLIALLAALAFGYTAGSIAESKGHHFWPYFWLGFALPVIGTIIAAALPTADQPPAA